MSILTDGLAELGERSAHLAVLLLAVEQRLDGEGDDDFQLAAVLGLHRLALFALQRVPSEWGGGGGYFKENALVNEVLGIEECAANYGWRVFGR